MSIFKFARPSKLRQVFEPSSLGGPLVLNELESTVQLVHPAIPAGENGADFRNFNFDGPLGNNLIDLGETPAGTIQYYQVVTMQHNDLAAQSLGLVLFDNRAGVSVTLFDTRQELSRFAAPGTVASGISVYFPRKIVVPEFCFLRMVVIAPGLAAGTNGTLRGNVRVQRVSDSTPPTFA